ncbi:hypothetical protein HY484_01435 [Candidatus Woesearchaeota archaeon]|nr:hypothetical protein [Candidatus Woesearchaeota archaeon]
MDKKAEIIFEVSWEVCNKVGGIFTVVQSKALQTMEHYDGNYFLVGPYFTKKAFGIFDEKVVPEHCKDCFDALKAEGIECHFGTWLIKGNPNVILIDFGNFAKNTNDVKRALWDAYKIDSLNTEYFDFDEPVVWSWAVGRVIEKLSESFAGKKIVAQFHEWLCAAGLLYLKNKNVKVGTVFTTHATTLGRTLANSDKDLYGLLDKINPDAEAAGFSAGTLAKHLTEKNAAKHADVFTTVSEITGIEAEKLLGRKPDVLLLNGLDMAKFPTFEEASIKHKLFKSRINQFLFYYFFPYYSFDIDKTLVYFLAGRYEFRDKGVDVFISALGRLNERLKNEGSDRTIVTFFWIPGNVKAIKPDLLESKTYFVDVKDSVDDVYEEIKNKITYLLISKKDITSKSLFSEDFLHEITPKVRRIVRKGVPPLSTHDLYNEDSDVIMNAFKSAGLFNTEQDRVKVIFYPIYLTGADGLLDTSYYESMQGSHLGVFPSYYEPWGYTPLEGGALGVSSVTTDLAGFGRYLCQNGCTKEKYPGIFVLERFGKTYEEIVSALTDILYRFAHTSSQERVENKIMAQKVAATADWKFFIENYLKAHNLAVEKVFG